MGDMMTESKKPLAFISYRREDSSAASRWLAQSIARTFGADSVFIDTESIRIADDWEQRIEDALAAATVVITVIGPGWFVASERKRPRIDDENDWVRNEIRHALDSKTPVLPVTLSGTPMPGRDLLPEAIAKLTRFQRAELRNEHWTDDLRSLLARMGELGFRQVRPDTTPYPTPKVTLRDLSTVELSEALGRLEGWESRPSDLPGCPGFERIELHRNFEFASFKDAIAFMAEAVPEIVQRKHHPRWENVWRSVSVWLSTWDIGHKPSVLDVELAGYLNELYARYPRPATPSKRASAKPADQSP